MTDININKDTQTKIKNVVFDLGNVLIGYYPKEFISENVLESDREHFYNTVFGSEYWNNMDLGSVTFDNASEYFTNLNPKYGKLIKYIFDTSCLCCLDVLKENVEAMLKVKKAGYNVYYLSNMNDKTFEALKDKYSFFNEFHGGVVSAYYKVIKPDYKIYTVFLEKYSLTPSECLFIDDSIKNVYAARELKMNSVCLEGRGSILSLLEQFNIKY